METAFADVLIVCGQGVYSDGSYYTEYPDRDVYLAHAISVRDIVATFAYTHVVCSGGFTQQARPDISEAESFLSMWQDTKSKPAIPDDHIFFDRASLDSAQNVYLSLMIARQGLGNIPIRRVGVFAAWQFKKRRFNALAAELGLIDSFYFHGLASVTEANAGELALKGEEDQLKKIEQQQDYLLLSDEWRTKREARDHSAPEHRASLIALWEEYSLIRDSLREVELARQRLLSNRNDEHVRLFDQRREQLRQIFRAQVIKPE